jgi:hypothetical protein
MTKHRTGKQQREGGVEYNYRQEVPAVTSVR